MVVLIPVAFIAGLVTAVSPCVLPILPIVLATGADGDRRRPYLVIAGLIAGFAFFTFASVQIISALHLPPSALRDLAIAVIAVFGLTLLVPRLSAWFERATTRFQTAGAGLIGRSSPGPMMRPTPATDTAGPTAPDLAARPPVAATPRRSSVAGGLLTGLGLGLVWTPCAGPILGAITSLAVTAPGSGSTLVLVVAYAIGAGLPLLAIAQGGRALLDRFRLRSASAWATRAFGALVLVTAGLMAVGADTALSADLTSSLPDWTGTLQALERSNPVQSALSQLEGHQQVADATANPGSGAAPGGSPNEDLAVGQNLPDLGSAPELVHIDHWLNSSPLTIQALRGKVVLVDFWTYSCINCIRTLPYVEGWYKKYAADGLVIIGVHTPEFAFEHDTGNVQAAIERFGITYPVAQDNEYGTWQNYQNMYWPADYLIDANGHIRSEHFGEGDYDKTEAEIRGLLAQAGRTVAPTATMANGPVPIAGGQTPETYLGSDRQSDYATSYPGDGSHTLSFPGGQLQPDAWALSGTWNVANDSVTETKAGAALELNFRARDVYLVMFAPASVTAHVKVTGASGTGPFATEDVSATGELTISTARLYHLVHLPSAQRATMTIAYDAPNVQAFAFTFGS